MNRNLNAVRGLLNGIEGSLPAHFRARQFQEFLEDHLGQYVLAEMQVVGVRSQVLDYVVVEATDVAGQRETEVVFVAPGRDALGLFQQADLVEHLEGGRQVDHRTRPAQDVVRAIDDCHLGTQAGQAEGSNQAGWACADNDDAFTFVHKVSPWLLFLVG
ncbi:hypothetical protein FQZ97_978330 [compost metagenome]